MPQITVQLLTAAAKLPRRVHDTDAGADLYSTEAVELAPGGIHVVPTGIAIALPRGYEAQIRPRSGLAANHGITVLNSPATIDAGFRGEIKVILINHGQAAVQLPVGTRIAQLVVAPVALPTFTEGPLDDSHRGAGGFGSTGKT